MDVEHQVLQKPVVHDRQAEKVQAVFTSFLESWKESDSLKYMPAISQLDTQPGRNTMSVAYADVEAYDNGLSTAMKENFYRFYPYLCQSVRNLMNERTKRGGSNADINIAFSGVPEKLKIRELRSKHVGTLTTITAQVTRTHPVHPELVLGSFLCGDCQTAIKNVPQQFKYSEPQICRNPACGNKKRFKLDLDSSVFVDFQKLRVQEIQEELPCGSTPRTLEIIVRGESVEVAQPGDKCEFTGTLIVVPDVSKLSLPGSVAKPEQGPRGIDSTETESGIRGLQSLGVRHLNYTLAFLATAVRPVNMRLGNVDYNPEQVVPEFLERTLDPEQWEKIFRMSRDTDLLPNLCNSIFPTIIGSDEIKQGILLMLFGGVPKITAEGTHLRGDINVLVVGDPSTAKSQFLRQVAAAMPRAVYTSGQATSAAGLTAAVVKDDETGDFVIEAGALMLADNGICCIDEFDKMDIKDQIAIHEAMEQQTISITKAGVKATLNARTSVLAAANPVGGVYDRSRPLRHNVNFSAAILSRFDLFFVLLDECDQVVDYAIGREIVQLHASRGRTSAVHRIYSKEEIQSYLMFAKHFKPRLTKAAAEHLVAEYKRLRQRDATGGQRSAWRVTVRQLESLVRLSEAFARLHCLDRVEVGHAEQACRLLSKSVIRVEQPEVCLDEEEDVVAPPLPPVEDPETAQTTQEEQAAPGTDAAPAKEKVKLTLDEYRRISSMLLCQLRRVERQAEQEEEIAGTNGESDETSPPPGLWRRSQLLNWYLSQVVDAVTSEEQLLEKKRLIKAVVSKLKNTNVVIELQWPGAAADSGAGETEGEGVVNDPLITLHPSYSADE